MHLFRLNLSAHPSSRCWYLLTASLLLIGLGRPLNAQNIQTTVPLQQLSSGFQQQSQLQWSLQGPGLQAGFGGGAIGNGVVAGSAAGAGGLRTGVGFASNGFRGSLGLNLASGSSRSISSGSASVTSLNGYPGFISSQELRPFVTGITPVVGGNAFGAPTRENVSSSLFGVQQQRQASMAQSRAAAARDSKQQAAEVSFRRAIRAEESGNLRMARANYRKALAQDQGPLRLQILSRMKTRGWL